MPGNEAQMAAMLRRDEAQIRIPPKRGLLVNLERNKRIVFGLDQKSWDADRIEKTLRRLRGVIIVGSTEAERWRGVGVVEGVHGFDSVQTREIKQTRCQTFFESYTLFKPLQEAIRVNTILEKLQPLDAGRQIDGSRDGADTGDRFRCATPKFSGEFQNNVAAK